MELRYIWYMEQQYIWNIAMYLEHGTAIFLYMQYILEHGTPIYLEQLYI